MVSKKGGQNRGLISFLMVGGPSMINAWLYGMILCGSCSVVVAAATGGCCSVSVVGCCIEKVWSVSSPSCSGVRMESKMISLRPCGVLERLFKA